MTRRCIVTLSMTALLVVLLGRPAHAQQPFSDDAGKKNPSHIPIPSATGDPKRLQELLAERLRKAQDYAELQKLLKDPDMQKLLLDVARNPDKFGVQDQINKLKNQQKPDFNDPVWRDLLGKVLDPKTPDSEGIAPEKREAWKKLLDRTTDPKPNPPMPPPMPPDRGQVPPMPLPMPPPDGSNPTPPTPPMPSPPAPPPQKKASSERFNKMMLDAMDRFKNSKSSLKDSSAWRQFLRDAGRTLTSGSDTGFGLTDKTAEWAQKFPSLSELVPADRLPRPNFEGAWLKNLPEWKFNPGQPSGPSGGWGTPALPSTSSAPGAETWAGLMWLVLGVAVVIAVVLMLRWNRDRLQAKSAESWRLGPWPVDPKTVRSREDVVKAFEYMSLLRLGRQAKSWHHWHIAGRLTGPHDGAVERVVEVYEKARYTPPTETLSEADLAAVRRDLADLAGVAAP